MNGIARSTEVAPEGRPLREFLHDEVVGGAILALAALVAITWANVHESSYLDMWAWVPLPDAPLHLDLDLGHWVNDALMALFFFVVGLEIKRELTVGELARPRDAAVPMIAAFGGMVVPAAIYVAVNGGTADAEAWGIPLATDIAFVLGALALLARSAPPTLRLFLLAVAIVDDIGGIVVIAAVYSDDIDIGPLGVAVGAVLVILLMRRLGEVRPAAYAPAGVALWLALHESGIHATLAGVTLGLLTPTRTRHDRDVLDELQHRIHPWSAAVVVPLFALANAGVVIRPGPLGDALTSRPALGVFFGLVVGKAVGISAATWITVRTGLGVLPAGMNARHVVGGAALAGIGFTVSLFIAELSVAGDTLAEVKVAILAAALVAAIVGGLVLRDRRRAPLSS